MVDGRIKLKIGKAKEEKERFFKESLSTKRKLFSLVECWALSLSKAVDRKFLGIISRIRKVNDVGY